ncbi:MAG TPA: hypothetical protein VK525_03275 [Candidatus Saccharimonadales bacterium]|nr:hypothetical protein [Candidatus Saccharimonadales bacterium]
MIFTNRGLNYRTEMNLRLWIAILVFTACAAFAIGWHIEYARTRSTPAGGSGHPIGSVQSPQADFECAADDRANHWHTIQTYVYQPVQTLYLVAWQICPADTERRRVRVMDANFQKVFYEYEDDVILRVEKVELLGDHVPQLLIVTGSSGTNDRIDWHVFSEVNGQPQEWTWPDYNAPAEKLLHADENFCCKTWNFHLRGHDIFLAEGIYHKDEDGNCCPSRGGVLVGLKPIRYGFKLESVQRISKPEYHGWLSQPFCSQCTLAGP